MAQNSTALIQYQPDLLRSINRNAARLTAMKCLVEHLLDNELDSESCTLASALLLQVEDGQQELAHLQQLLNV